MSHTHLIKRIDDLDEDTKIIHFTDKNAKPLRIDKKDGMYQTTNLLGTNKSTSVNALVKKHIERVDENTGPEVIITKGPHKGKRGVITETATNKQGQKIHLIQGLGYHNEDSFFHTNLTEEVNGVGGGAIAGVGVGPQGEPGVRPGNVADVIITALQRRKKLKEEVS